MRVVRFFASSGAAFLIGAIFYIVSVVTADYFREQEVFSLFRYLGFILSFYLFPICYIGCLIGEVVYTFVNKMNNRFIVTVIFALIGAFYSYLFQKVLLHRNPYDLFFYAAIIGSISFYWTHFISNRKLVLQLSLFPVYVIILFVISTAF